MKKIVMAGVLLVLTGCSQTTYTEATRADDPAAAEHAAPAPGTKITTAGGACVDSTGAPASCPTPGM
ncbi:hypothetical protein CHU32_02530 [Superficieibacter electus]|uniref:Lipoprotein n=1 Tax=Superficieibacter electus TaxID=2022662 RepID=A0A2P5GUU9_9ENTR|nr:hypothetical protein [Superficieibacter electus]POP44304.1 hypothetical protein CHU33_12640 [Superficieibacter electus]POP50322.1 hypothetical protein CHU32_02530 [Superficieibacter electus]